MIFESPRYADGQVAMVGDVFNSNGDTGIECEIVEITDQGGVRVKDLPGYSPGMYKHEKLIRRASENT